MTNRLPFPIGPVLSVPNGEQIIIRCGGMTFTLADLKLAAVRREALARGQR
jgi:hypothetical protein